MFKSKTFFIGILIFFILLISTSVNALNETNTTIMVNPIDSDGHSYDPSISDDGKWITYESKASNIVANDTNNKEDIFLYDVVNKITTMVNPLNSNSGSYYPSISDDGKWITYVSRATNIVANDTNEVRDVFLYDVVNNITTMVNPLNSNGNSWDPSISGDGKWITYRSWATNIVANDTNEVLDVFLYDVVNNITTMVNPLNSNGNSYYPSISDDGKWITYYSKASNIVANDTNDVSDVFLYDVVNNITTMVNPLNSNGSSWDPSISGDGKWITYYSSASNIVANDTNEVLDVFLYDVVNNITTMVNPLNSNGDSYYPSISDDGKWITYYSRATNIVANDTNNKEDIFLYDVVNNITTMVNPLNIDGHSRDTAISGDGKWITYRSWATNIVDNDTNNKSDVFLFSRYIEENTTNETPINETTNNDTPTNETPTNNTSINETPINETTNNDTPTNETPTNNTSINETTKETPVNDTPIAENNTTVLKDLETLKTAGLPLNYLAIILITIIAVLTIYKRK